MTLKYESFIVKVKIVLKFYLKEPGNNFKHKSKHELYLFGSICTDYILCKYFRVGSRYKIQPWTENTINQSTVN